MKSVDCSTGLHEYCSPCECECHKVLPEPCVQAQIEHAIAAIGNLTEATSNVVQFVLHDAEVALTAAHAALYQVKDADTNPKERGFNPDTDIPDCRPKR